VCEETLEVEFIGMLGIVAQL